MMMSVIMIMVVTMMPMIQLLWLNSSTEICWRAQVLSDDDDDDYADTSDDVGDDDDDDNVGDDDYPDNFGSTQAQKLLEGMAAFCSDQL